MEANDAEDQERPGHAQDAVEEPPQDENQSDALGDIDKIGEAVVCSKVRENLCSLGQYKEALKEHKRLLTIARESGNLLQEQRAWANIGSIHLARGKTRNLQESLTAGKKAEKAFFKSLNACEKRKETVKRTEYMTWKAQLYRNIGHVYELRGAVKQSADHIKRAMSIAEEFKLDDELYMCHSSLANMYQKGGQYSQALRSLELALKQAEKLRNKAWEREMIVHMAKIHVSMGDFLAAKHCLKKAYKLESETDIGGKKLKKMFLCIEKMQEAIQDLRRTTEERKKAKLFEVVADCHAELGDNMEAIGKYLEVDKYTSVLSSEEKAGLHVSLARSYADLHQYDIAIYHYNRKLQERKENPEECCNTLLLIAELEERKGSNYDTVSNIYMSALEAAKKAKIPQLQVQTLKSLVALQKLCKQTTHLEETEKKLLSVTKKYNINDDSKSQNDEDDSEGSERMEEDGNLSISDLTTSDESDHDGVATLMVVGGSVRKKCKLTRGHPVNSHDNLGLLPLHEACNHGHLSTVEFLLDSGAGINDRGGEKCGGTTPLIDAASCGNMDMVRLLVNRGANVMAKDKDGNCALDSLQDSDTTIIYQFPLSPTIHDLNDPDLATEPYQSAIDNMGTSAEGRGATETLSHHAADCNSESVEPRSALVNAEENVGDDWLINTGMVVATAGLRGSRGEYPDVNDSSNEASPLSSAKEFIARFALDNPTKFGKENDYFDAADHIMLGMDFNDDSIYPNETTDSGDMNTSFQHSSLLDESLNCTDVSPSPVSRGLEHAIPSVGINPSVQASVVSPEKRIENREQNDNGLSRSTDLPNKSAHASEKPQTPPVQFHNIEKPTYNNSMRVKVKIGQHTLLIPIQPADQERTISWLAQEATERYMNMFLMRPTLTLTTQDETILCPCDTISMVLQDGEILKAKVSTWERPRLEERYVRSCQLCLGEVNKPVSSALRQCDLSGQLQLDDMGLGLSSLQPVLRALDGQKITELRINGNRLGNSGVESVMKLIVRLPILKVLTLDLNGITADGIHSMASTLKSETCLQSLRTLSLSHNCLGDSVAEPLTSFINGLPELCQLTLCSCSMTAKVFTPSFCDALKGKRLTHVNVAENQIRNDGIESLLGSLHPECLEVLDISHTRTASDRDITVRMLDFMFEDNCSVIV